MLLRWRTPWKQLELLLKGYAAGGAVGTRMAPSVGQTGVALGLYAVCKVSITHSLGRLQQWQADPASSAVV